MKPDRDPPPVVSDVRTRHVLAFAPVETIDDPLRRDALDSANGVDLVKRRVQRALAVAGTIVILLVVARCLLGCAALDRAVPAIGVAHDVAKAGCAILAATDGSSADVLAATEAMRREILEAQADAAKARGANAETIDALVKSIALLSATVREQAGQVVTAAGNGPARLPPCPVASAPQPADEGRQTTATDGKNPDAR